MIYLVIIDICVSELWYWKACLNPWKNIGTSQLFVCPKPYRRYNYTNMHFKIQSQPIGMFEILPSKNIAHVGMIFVVSLLPNTDKPILLLCPVSYWHC